MDRPVRHRIPTVLFTVIAVVTFAFVLLGYVLEYIMKQQIGLYNLLIEWAVVVAAFAFLLGLVNILAVHYRKARRPREGGIYSLVFLLAALLMLAATVFPPGLKFALDYVVNPVGASLAALMVFTLALAAFRLLHTRRGERAKSIVFVLVVGVVLLGSVLEPLGSVRDWVVNVFGMAGMRGLLLGVALGTVITAFRVLWPRSEP